jgi:glycolate oxidase iron-sulfur subunit
MRAEIGSPWRDTLAGARAEHVLRACVHCGMCNAVCPTYQLTGDERDGPRGRIYLIKQVLEGGEATRLTQHHLDRCLTCRACETACPSGVAYHRLVEVGREALAPRRGLVSRFLRFALRKVMLSPPRLDVLLALGRLARPLLPASLRAKIPPPPPRATPAPLGPPPPGLGRRMTLLRGCVQASATPQTNAAAQKVFAAAGIALGETPGLGCCGALSAHLGATEEARALARRNLAAWTAELDAGAEALVVTASGCAAFIRDYPDLLDGETEAAERLARVLPRLKDPVEVLEATPLPPLRAPADPRVAVHIPCTLRNGPGLGAAPARLLSRLGFSPQPVADAHLCCGSAGAYALLQPKLATALRERKLAALQASAPDQICTANVGCQLHLGAATTTPVRHWLEAVADLLG